MINTENKIVTAIQLYTVANQRNNPSTIYAKQKDSNSRFIVATLYDYNAKKMSFPSNSIIRLSAELPDGVVQQSIGELNADNTITAELNEFILASPGMVSCDLTISHEEEYYQECESDDDGALLVIANSSIPSDGEIKIGETFVFGIQIGDYVKLSTKTVQITANRFYVQVENSNYTSEDVINYKQDGSFIQDGDSITIAYTIVDKEDVTFTKSGITAVEITIPSTCNYHGYMAGVNIKNGNTPPTYTFTNNSSLTFKIIRFQQVITTYQPAPNTETIMAFFYTGNDCIYCYLSEV